MLRLAVVWLVSGADICVLQLITDVFSFPS